MRRKLFFVVPLLLAGVVGSLLAYREMTGARANKSAIQRAPAVQQIEIPAGTKLRVRLSQTLDTARNRAGDPFSAILDTPVVVKGSVVVPTGTPFRGHLTAAKPSGRLKGRGYMAVKLDSFELDGQAYPIATPSQSRTTGSHKKRNWAMIGGGSGFGGLVGGLAGGLKGGLIGAGAGAAAGTAGAAITGQKQVRLPVETPLTFSLEAPVVVRS